MGRKIKIIKKMAFLSAFSKQQVVVCKAQALKLQMLKSGFSGLDSNIIYKAHISLFTCHMKRNAVNRVSAAAVAAAAVAGDVAVAALVSLLQIHLC